MTRQGDDPKSPTEPLSVDALRHQSKALQKLIEEAQRVQREISQHLRTLWQAGRPERRKNPR